MSRTASIVLCKAAISMGSVVISSRSSERLISPGVSELEGLEPKRRVAVDWCVL